MSIPQCQRALVIEHDPKRWKVRHCTREHGHEGPHVTMYNEQRGLWVDPSTIDVQREDRG